MFYDGFDDKGSCPGNGRQHTADGPVFDLPHDGPETENAQRNWRFCRKCFAMHWSPAPDQLCARLGPHDAVGSWNFVLPHSVSLPRPGAGSSWRCCVVCAVLYWEPALGQRCSAGEHHVAGGPAFTLPLAAVLRDR